MKNILLICILSVMSSKGFALTPCEFYGDSTFPYPVLRTKASIQADILWKLVLSEEYRKLPALNDKERVLNLNPNSTYKELIELRMRAFEVAGDIRPTTDSKMTHINGPAALVKIIFKKTIFTGMFSQGEKVGLMRGSFAFNPKEGTGPHDFPQPGLALKLFVDGSPSKNILAMGSLDGEKNDGRFFSTPMATKLQDAQLLKGKIGELVFKTSTISPGHLKLDHLSRINSDGKRVALPVTPEWIVFTPTVFAQTSGDKKAHDFRQELLKIPSGSHIYTIQGAFKNANGSFSLIEMGQVYTASRFVASFFADKKLHFRHEGALPNANFMDFLKWQCGE